MRAALRDLYPRRRRSQSNRPEPMFNRVDWLQIWQAINPGNDHRLQFRRGTGHMIVTTTPGPPTRRYRQGQPHRDHDDNVDSFRLYLNDQMVDFSKPVTIVVNKKGPLRRPDPAGVDEMLKDQLFLGRGWRYFTGQYRHRRRQTP